MLRTFSITDIGRKRKMNQDYVYIAENPIGNLANLFLVADGMGGHNAGEYASQYAVEIVKEEVEHSFEKNPQIILNKAITKAHEEICKRASEDEKLEGMGTTMVAATCIGKYLQVANIGDSRLYIINDEITQITRDHSLVEEMVRTGGLNREQAKNHPDKNIITRAIGAGETAQVDFFTVELNEGDTILMCSDGLTNMLEDEEIKAIVKNGKDLEERGNQLIKEANERGGKDNIAVVLVESEEQ